jgi:hypothetical protein
MVKLNKIGKYSSILINDSPTTRTTTKQKNYYIDKRKISTIVFIGIISQVKMFRFLNPTFLATRLFCCLKFISLRVSELLLLASNRAIRDCRISYGIAFTHHPLICSFIRFDTRKLAKVSQNCEVKVALEKQSYLKNNTKKSTM